MQQLLLSHVSAATGMVNAAEDNREIVAAVVLSRPPPLTADALHAVFPSLQRCGTDDEVPQRASRHNGEVRIGRRRNVTSGGGTQAAARTTPEA